MLHGVIALIAQKREKREIDCLCCHEGSAISEEQLETRKRMHYLQ